MLGDLLSRIFCRYFRYLQAFFFRACLDVTEPEITVEEVGEEIEVISLGETVKLQDLTLYLKYCKSKALFSCTMGIVILFMHFVARFLLFSR